MKSALAAACVLSLSATLFAIPSPLPDDLSASIEPEQPRHSEERQIQSSDVTNRAGQVNKYPVDARQTENRNQLQYGAESYGMKPVTISIPSIGVEAAIQPTGILPTGEMAVPENVDEVGWFEPGFRAGAKGNSVLAGHVDSLTGPAVFYQLEKIAIGDQVKLTDASGRQMIFEVKNAASYKTEQAPLEEIFGSSNKRMINLITCTGQFNRKIGSHEERLVVSAELVHDSEVTN